MSLSYVLSFYKVISDLHKEKQVNGIIYANKFIIVLYGNYHPFLIVQTQKNIC